MVDPHQPPRERGLEFYRWGFAVPPDRTPDNFPDKLKNDVTDARRTVRQRVDVVDEWLLSVG